MKPTNQNKKMIERLMAELPAGSDRAFLSILRHYVGRSAIITAESMLFSLAKMGFPNLDRRQLRLIANRLRKSGVLICSSGGTGGGYWLAADWPDLIDYIETNPLARAIDYLEQIKAMKKSATELFGANGSGEKQLVLFDPKTYDIQPALFDFE